MTAKQFILLLTAAAAVLPSIALAHDQFKGFENDSITFIFITTIICSVMAIARSEAKTSFAKCMIAVLFTLSYLIGILFSGASVFLFYDRFNETVAFLLHILIAAQVAVAHFMFCRSDKKPPDKDTDAPAQ